jgi:hypothetical protein
MNRRRRLLVRWGAGCGAASAVLMGAILTAGRGADPAAPGPDGHIGGLTSVLSRTISDDLVRFRFEEVGRQAGIAFRHFPSVRRSLLPEDMGSGLAWGDFDDDGDPDLFLVNFAGSILDPAAAVAPCALLRNDGGTFTDVTRHAGLDQPLLGLGAAWGDFDGDGALDLYVTAHGPNVLYRNRGDGTFHDVTAEAGVGDAGFGAGCAWSDHDRDGDIDLYVCNYVEFETRASDRTRVSRQYGSEIPYTLNPSSYAPQPNRLYRNRGDGTFEEVAARAGVADPEGRSLSAAWFDFDDDGWVDLYVANDVSANGVFRNRGDGTFQDLGASSLAADYRGAMGLGVGDYDRDGDTDLFVTHWLAQENALFENMTAQRWLDASGAPRLFFMDSAEILGLGQISLAMVGWATGFADFDNDGLLDLWVVNGSTLEAIDDPTRLRPQPMHLYWQKPGGGFYQIAAEACAALERPVVGRGGAHADYDGDGRIDLAVMIHGATPWLLRNASPDTGHWLGLHLRQTGGNTRALGARVSVRAGSIIQHAQVGTGGSYLSQHDTDLHFGLGVSSTVDEIRVRWPDGTEQIEGPMAADQRVVLRRRNDPPG